MYARLVFQSGNSHKEYQVSVEAVADGFVTNFAYGRVGSALKRGTKTASPVCEDKAMQIAEKLIREKIAKGYIADTEQSQTSPKISVVDTSTVPIMLPQLANPIEANDLLSMGGLFGLQTKYDGQRRILIYRKGIVTGLNRRGLPVALDSTLESAFRSLCDEMAYESLVIDGEDMGSHIRIFDIMEWNYNELREFGFQQRMNALQMLNVDILRLSDQSLADVLPIAQTWWSDKHDVPRLIEDHRARGEEGLVIRLAGAPYNEGWPNNKGDMRKIKFVNDCSVIVSKITEGKRSVSISVLDTDGKAIPVGRVTIPANVNLDSIRIGSVIDVQYLWCIGEGGSLFQPVFKGDRTGEILPEACTADQLVYRNPDILKAS